MSIIVIWSLLTHCFTVSPGLCCNSELVHSLSKMSLHELLAVSSDYVSFANQIFVVLRQVTKSSAKAPIPDVNNIVEIIGIARNKDFSGYSLSRLDISRHMTMSFAQFFFVSSRIIEAQNLGQKALVTFVPSTTNFYSSRDKRTIVINSVLHETDHDRISVRDQFVDAINHGLFGCLRCNEGYRSGRAKKSPVLHTGYTMSNCGEYKNNRQNQMILLAFRLTKNPFYKKIRSFSL